MTSESTIPWQVKFIALALIWGSSFLLMKYGLRGLEPVQIAGLRIASGAVILLVLLRVTGGRLPRGGRTWLHLFTAAIFLTSVPFTLFALGETRVSSALAGIGNSITPVSMVIFGLLLLPSEKVTRTKLLAVALGFIGVIVISEPWNTIGRPDPVGFGIVLLAGACYGLGWPYVRRTLAHADLGGLSQPTALLVCGTVQMVVVELVWWLLHRGQMRLPWSVHDSATTHDAWVALGTTLVLGVVGTGLAYMLQFDVVRDAGTVVSSTVTYLIPVVSVLLGVLVLGEHIGLFQLGGFVLVLAAALIVGRPASGWASLLARTRAA
ncbi:MAG TPA: DMT family transporter [Phycicoccus sp.]|nr:DMT family transporter [Phycicoccus sp.]